MSWVAVGVSAASLVSGLSAGSSAKKAAAKSNELTERSLMLQERMAGMAQEQWNLYKEKALPLLNELSGMRATTDRTAEEVALAAGDVKQAFAGARSSLARRVGLEEAGGSNRTAAILAPSYMDEAAGVASAMTTARRAERDRVENTSWNRTLQAIGAYQGLPTNASSNLSTAASGITGNARTAADLARMYSTQSGQGGYAAAYFGANAANRWMQRPGPKDGGGAINPYPTGYGDLSGDAPVPGGYDYYSAADLNGLQLRHGGAVRRPYADGGKVRGPGTGTSDSIATAKRPGTFILSSDTVRAIGTKKVDDLVEKAGVRKSFGGGGENPDAGGVPVRLSNGEYAIPPEVTAYYGEEFFNNLQKKYHKPTADETDFANGGAIRRRLPSSVEAAIFHSMPQRAIARSRR